MITYNHEVIHAPENSAQASIYQSREEGIHVILNWFSGHFFRNRCGRASFLLSPTFLKKQRGYCNGLRPSIGLSVMLSPAKLFDEIQQIWCVGYSHEWDVQRQTFFWPRPQGPWGGVKRSNII